MTPVTRVKVASRVNFPRTGVTPHATQQDPFRHRLPAAAGPRPRARRAHPGRERHQPRRRPADARATPRTRRTASRGDLCGVHPRAQRETSRCPTRSVDPTVDEYALTAAPAAPRPRPARSAPGPTSRRARRRPRSVSAPEPVAGYGAVGVTWEHGTAVPRTRSALPGAHPHRRAPGRAGSSCEYHDDHGPDPGSAEARHARPGTDALLVGDVDEVQVRSTSDRRRAAAGPEARGHRPRHSRARRRSSSPRIDTNDDGVAEPALPRRAPSGTARDRAAASGDDGRRSRCRPRRSPRSRRSTPAPSGAPTRACATRARCTTSRCTPASCTTR